MDEWLSSHSWGLPLTAHGDGEPEGRGVRFHRTASGRLFLSSREGIELEVSPDTLLFSNGADDGVAGGGIRNYYSSDAPSAFVGAPPPILQNSKKVTLRAVIENQPHDPIQKEFSSNLFLDVNEEAGENDQKDFSSCDEEDEDIFCGSHELRCKRGWSLDSSRTSLSEELREFCKTRSQTAYPLQAKKSGKMEKEMDEAQARTEADRSSRGPSSSSSSSSSHSESYRYYLACAAGIHVTNPSKDTNHRNNSANISSDEELEGGRGERTEEVEEHPPRPTSIKIPPPVDLEMLGDIIHPALLHRRHNRCATGLERDAFSPMPSTSLGRFFFNNSNTDNHRALSLFDAYHDGGPEFGIRGEAWWGRKAVAVPTLDEGIDYSYSSSSLSSSTSLPTSQRKWTDEKRVSDPSSTHKDGECCGFSADLTLPPVRVCEAIATVENTDSFTINKGVPKVTPDELFATHLRVGEEVQKVRALLDAMEGCKLSPIASSTSQLLQHGNQTGNNSAAQLPNLDMALAKEKVAFFENNLETLGKRLMEMRQQRLMEMKQFTTGQESEKDRKCIKDEGESENSTHIPANLGLVNGTETEAREEAAPRPPPRFLLVHEDLSRLIRAFAAALMVFITVLLLLSVWVSEAVDDGYGYGIDTATARYSTTGRTHSRSQRAQGSGDGLVWAWMVVLACVEAMERVEHTLFGTQSFSAAKFRKAVETLTSATTLSQKREDGEEGPYSFGLGSSRLGLGRGDEGRDYYIDEASGMPFYPDHNSPSYQANEGRVEESEEDRRERVMLEMRRLHYMTSNGFEPVHQHQQELTYTYTSSPPSALRSSMFELATPENHRHDPSRTHIPYTRPQKGKEIKEDGKGERNEEERKRRRNSLQRSAKSSRFSETLPTPQRAVSQVVAGVAHIALSSSTTATGTTAGGGVRSGLGKSQRGVQQGHRDHSSGRTTNAANTIVGVGRDVIARDGTYWLWRQKQHTAHVGRFYSQIGDRRRGLGCDGVPSTQQLHPSSSSTSSTLSELALEGGCCDIHVATLSNATLGKKCVRACIARSDHEGKAVEGHLLEGKEGSGDDVWNDDDDTTNTPSSFVLRRSSACYFSRVPLPKNANDASLIPAAELPYHSTDQTVGEGKGLFSFASFEDSSDRFSFAAYQAGLARGKERRY